MNHFLEHLLVGQIYLLLLLLGDKATLTLIRSGSLEARLNSIVFSWLELTWSAVLHASWEDGWHLHISFLFTESPNWQPGWAKGLTGSGDRTRYKGNLDIFWLSLKPYFSAQPSFI